MTLKSLLSVEDGGKPFSRTLWWWRTGGVVHGTIPASTFGGTVGAGGGPGGPGGRCQVEHKVKMIHNCRRIIAATTITAKVVVSQTQVVQGPIR